MVEKVLRIEAKIDSKEAEAGLKDIDKMCADTKENIEKMTADMGFKTKPTEIISTAQLNKAKKRIKEIDSEISKLHIRTDRELNRTNADRSLRYSDVEKKAAELLKEEKEIIKALIAEQKQLTQAAAEYEAKQKAIAEEKQRQLELARAQKKAEKQRQLELAKAQKDAEKQHAADIKSVNTYVGGSMAADDFVSKIQTAEQYDAALTRIRTRMGEIEDETQYLAQLRGINPNDALAANKEYQKLRKNLAAMEADTRKFKTESKGTFDSAKKGAEQLGASMKKCLKQMAKYTLAVFGARSAFFAVKNAIRQVLADNEQLNNTVTAMKGVLSNAIAPYVERLVYYLQYAMAYVNLFIKTLTGVDMAADYNAKALKKQAEATKETAKAAKEANKQLASFDEMNVLSSDKSENSNTGALENAAATLDLPDVSGGKFEKICQTIKTYLNEIEAAAGVALIAVGFILLACGQIPLGIAAIITGITLTARAISSWDSLAQETQTLINTIMAIAGAAFLAIGLILVCTGINIPLGVAMIAAGAALLIGTAALNWNTMSEKIEPVLDKIKKVLFGAFIVVLGILLCLTGVGMPLGIALIIEGVKSIKSGEEPSGATLKEHISNAIETAKTYIKIAATIVLGVLLCLTVVGIPFGIALIYEAVSKAKNGEAPTGESIKECIKNVVEDIKGFLENFGTIVLGVILCLTVVGLPFGIALIKKAVSASQKGEAVNGEAIVSVVKNTWEKITGFWNSKIKPVFTAQWWKNKLAAIPDGAKAALNTAIAYVERAINWMIGKINSISFKVADWVPGIGGTTIGFNLPYVNIPRLARGGIVNNPGRGQAIIAGEAGAEAVLPLQNNTEWMDMLVDKIVERTAATIINKIIVDGKEILSSCNKAQQRFEVATNGGVL